jgi:hypothetical protein
MVRRERESTNQIARFGVLKLPIPAISNASAAEKQTPIQSLKALFTDDQLEIMAKKPMKSQRGSSPASSNANDKARDRNRCGKEKKEKSFKKQRSKTSSG